MKLAVLPPASDVPTGCDSNLRRSPRRRPLVSGLPVATLHVVIEDLLHPTVSELDRELIDFDGRYRSVAKLGMRDLDTDGVARRVHLGALHVRAHGPHPLRACGLGRRALGCSA